MDPAAALRLSPSEDRALGPSTNGYPSSKQLLEARSISGWVGKVTTAVLSCRWCPLGKYQQSNQRFR